MTIYNPPFTTDGSDRARWIERLSESLRFVDWADSIASRTVDHTGWYCDEHGDTMARGAVIQLPARKGNELFLSAIALVGPKGRPEDPDVYCVDFDQIHGDAVDAALSADNFAELFAETEREYQELSSASFRFHEIAEEIKALRLRARAAAAEYRKVRNTLETAAPNLRALLCERLDAFRAERRELYKEREQIEETYGAAKLADAY